MNKFLSRFSTALISLSLAVGIGVSLSSEKGIIRAEATDGTITLANGSYDNSGSITWVSEHLTIKQEKGSSTSAVNSSYVSAPRWYAKHLIKFTPVAGYSIDSVVITSTESKYSKLSGATYENATVSVSGLVATITPTLKTKGFTAIMGEQTRVKTITYTYSLASSDSVTTSLSVSPTSWKGYNTETLNIANFTVTATTTATDDGYVFQGIGFGTGDEFVARDATFSSGNPLTTDTRLQWKAKYPTTAGGSEYLYAGVDLTVNEDTLSSISVGGSMTKTEYYSGESWDPTGLSVTATYASGSIVSINSSEITWTYSPESPAVGVTSVVATATYNGKTADSSAQTVTVLNGILFDFEAYFSTYASDWGTAYADHTISSSNLGVTSTSATISITGSNKQSAGSTIDTMPVVKGSTISFTLDASETRVIDTVKVNFVQWGSKTQTISLHKGANTSIDSSRISFPYDGNSISASGLKSKSFTCITHDGNQIGIKSIVVTLVESSFGTLDHISVSSLPNKTTYCVGEEFASEGIVVTAYDGADEATASSKDVTDSATIIVDDGYVFNESNISDPFIVDVEYTEGSISKETSFDIVVVAATNYELVTTAPNDWSGEYLVVTNNNKKLLGLDCSLESPDVASNYVTLTATDNVIATNSNYSITIEKMEGGYSVKSTLHGYYIGGGADKNYLLTNKTVPYLNTITLNDDGSVALTSNTKSLAFNATTGQERFRYYGSGYLPVSLYRRAASSSASIFADYFINDLHCDATGATAPSVDEWNALKDIYAELDAYDQLTFKIAVGNPSGTNVEQAVAKYDYIITKYGVTNYVDFMGRVEYGSLTLANNRIEFADKLDSQSTIICVVVLTLLSVSIIGGYIILKKTKEN
ncbi:MAG: bacterial Ig-like domain-containing protein [Erysipelotrichaceae bacterium]|nr:bacterial Ig-like domain-containing protein [Erysipelotrichaceae bacterium]